MTETMQELRCVNCHKKLCEYNGGGHIEAKCPKCGHLTKLARVGGLSPLTSHKSKLDRVVIPDFHTH